MVKIPTADVLTGKQLEILFLALKNAQAGKPPLTLRGLSKTRGRSINSTFLLVRKLRERGLLISAAGRGNASAGTLVPTCRLLVTPEGLARVTGVTP